MSKFNVQIIAEDQVVKEVEVAVERTVRAVLEEAGHNPSLEVFWFADGNEGVLILETPLHQLPSPDGRVILRPHRCRQVEVRVNHDSRHHGHAFSPHQKVGHVKRWAIEHFALDHPEHWRLSTDHGADGQLPDQESIGKFVRPGACDLNLFLVHLEPEQIVVTIVNEEDGKEYRLKNEPSAKVEKVIEEFYADKIKRAPRPDDRIRCEEGGGDVLAHRDMTLREYQKKHCHCDVWLFAGGTGGASWPSLG